MFKLGCCVPAGAGRIHGKAPANIEACLSDLRMAEDVSTSAFANSGANSSLDTEAMRATLPFPKAPFPGRGSWEATPCGRVETKGPR